MVRREADSTHATIEITLSLACERQSFERPVHFPTKWAQLFSHLISPLPSLQYIAYTPL